MAFSLYNIFSPLPISSLWKNLAPRPWWDDDLERLVCHLLSQLVFWIKSYCLPRHLLSVASKEGLDSVKFLDFSISQDNKLWLMILFRNEGEMSKLTPKARKVQAGDDEKWCRIESRVAAAGRHILGEYKCWQTGILRNPRKWHWTSHDVWYGVLSVLFGHKRKRPQEALGAWKLSAYYYKPDFCLILCLFKSHWPPPVEFKHMLYLYFSSTKLVCYRIGAH